MKSMFARHDIFRLTTVINNNIVYLRPETMFFTVRPQSNFSSQILRKDVRSFDTPAFKMSRSVVREIFVKQLLGSRSSTIGKLF